MTSNVLRITSLKKYTTEKNRRESSMMPFSNRFIPGSLSIPFFEKHEFSRLNFCDYLSTYLAFSELCKFILSFTVFLFRKMTCLAYPQERLFLIKIQETIIFSRDYFFNTIC